MYPVDRAPPGSLVSIYALVDPKTFEVRYIGVSRNPARRLLDHLQEGRRGKRLAKARWISGLLRRGQQPLLEVIECCHVEDWREREIFWISRSRRAGCRLLNHTDGGEGTIGYRHSEETLRKISASNRGKRRSEEARAKMRIRKMSAELKQRYADILNQPHVRALKAAGDARRRGKPIPAEIVAKRAAAQTGLKRSAATRARMSIAARLRVARQRASLDASA